VTEPELLALIAEKGPALCTGAGAAGIASIEISSERVSVVFAPPFGRVAAPALGAKPASDPMVDDDSEPDALDDPSTYEDGVVPGYPLDEEPA
jgi:hypothetical protein